jgi:hypothetical protein
MPLNATVENDLIASFIGAPVPIYNPDDENDRLCVNVYNYFKPAILRFLAFVNEPRNPEHYAGLLNTMRFIRSQHTQNFFQRAATLGLIPAGPDFNDEWISRWFDDLFPDEPGLNDYALSVVIQGGEGVNFYTHYKYDNVPTHDTDTRVLVGNHFNYTRPLAVISMAAKQWMHKYRFFLAFGLQAALDAFHSEVRPLALMGDEPYLSYITTWIDDYENITLRIIPSVCGQTFQHWIYTSTYDMNNDMFISPLLDITVEVETDDNMFECGIIDLFVPYRRPAAEQPRYRVGQSDAIFSLFATPQAASLRMPTNDIVPAGHVPSVDIPLTMPDTIPSFGGITIPVRLLPHGYMLFETLRMLYVSEALGRYNYGNKFIKYKQKLTAMLGTLMDADISRFIFDQCQGMKAKEPARAERMTGGREPLLVEQPRIEEAPTLEKIDRNTPAPGVKPKMKFPKPTEEQVEARRYSKELLAMFVKGQELPDPDGLTKVQQMGHMDCMSYIYPEMKDFRLPLLPEEREANKESTPTTTIQMLVEAKLLPADTKLLSVEMKPTKEGKTKKRTTRRKKYRHSVHTTYRK